MNYQQKGFRSILALLQVTAICAMTIGSATAQVARRPQSCYQPPAGTMVAWYPFDDAAGPSTNLATGNAAVWTGGAPLPIAGGEVLGALQFDGLSTYLDAPDSIVTNFGPAPAPFTAFNCALSNNRGDFSTCQGDFSIDVWVSVTALPARGVMTIVDKRDTTATGYSFALYTNGINTYAVLQLNGINHASTLPIVNFPLSPLWEHLAVTVHRATPIGLSRISFYYNGSTVPFGAPVPLTNAVEVATLKNGAALRIGANGPYDGPINFFNGAMDELEIYNRVLFPQEVNGIYTAGASGKCKPPL